MNELEKRYQLKIDELNLIISEAWEKRKKDSSYNIIDDILFLLMEGYIFGLTQADRMMGAETEINLAKMQRAIYQEIDGKTFVERAEEHIAEGSEGRLRNLAESEFHRVYNTAVADGVEETGKTNVTKTWVTVGDDRVRDTHSYLEGMTIPMGRDFYTFDGDHAPFPGTFENPENNVNCRCILRYSREAN